MADPQSRNPLNTSVQKALITPSIASSDLVLQLMMVDPMRGDPREVDNQLKGYPKFVNDSKLHHIIIVGYAFIFFFSNPHNLKHFVFKNHIWWHDKAIVVPYVFFQRSNIRYFLLHEHHDAMYNDHVGVAKTMEEGMNKLLVAQIATVHQKLYKIL